MEQEKADYFDNSELLADPLYGLIDISPFEMRIINSPEFQRLRHIKQLGFVNFVYHTAEHSRFSHSIGVCHRVKMLIAQLEKNLRQNKRYQFWKKFGTNPDAGDLVTGPIEDTPISPVEKIVIAAAALLHDISHAPFSHEIESQSKSLNLGIPKHDHFDKNPALFKYLFDTDNSILAQVIAAHNYSFWKLFANEINRWLESLLDDDGNAFNNWYNYLSADPNGYLKVSGSSDDQEFPCISSDDPKLVGIKLPILGVMIFEILLFEKPENWVNFKGKTKLEKIKTSTPINVKPDWTYSNYSGIIWRPMHGWFRPYRKDLIGNTICADLMDYIDRDGRETGVVSYLDFKFLDRMTITKVPFASDKKHIPLNIRWTDIPESCEHIVFDIYDHKRGFIRGSVITEILACLQARYQLAERVYEHRVVEGARSMLQEVALILSKEGILKLEDLHTSTLPGLNEQSSEFTNAGLSPTSDESFLYWVSSLATKEQYKSNSNVLNAARLSQYIINRRIYRESVIIDGIQGFLGGSIAGPDSNCESIADILIPESNIAQENIENWKTEVSNYLRTEALKKYDKSVADALPGTLVTISARKWGSRFKLPLVLVAKPFISKSKRNNDDQNLDIQPLFACKYPLNIKTQLDAIQNAYNSLYKIYLFVHPKFHSAEFEEANREVSNRFLAFLKIHSSITWLNSIHIDQLLQTEPIDVHEFIHNSNRPQRIEKFIAQFLNKCEAKLSILEKTDSKIRPINSEKLRQFIIALALDKKQLTSLESKSIQQRIIDRLEQEQFDQGPLFEAARQDAASNYRYYIELFQKYFKSLT